MKRGRKKQKVQTKFKNTKFSYDQYWSVQYTEKFSKGNELDYKTIIKARSRDLAQSYLIKKNKSLDNGSKIKGIRLSLLHKESTINNKPLTIQDWEDIRSCSFPNEVDILFKYNRPRKSNYSKRWNYIKTIPMKTRLKTASKGRKACKKYSREEKAYMVMVNGKLKPWLPTEREGFKEKIIIQMKLHNNNRAAVTKALGYKCSKTLKNILENKFIEIDWDKEYPPPKKNHKYLTDASKNKMLENIEKFYPEILKYKKEGLSARKISTILPLSRRTISKYFKYGQKQKN